MSLRVSTGIWFGRLKVVVVFIVYCMQFFHCAATTSRVFATSPRAFNRPGSREVWAEGLSKDNRFGEPIEVFMAHTPNFDGSFPAFH